MSYRISGLDPRKFQPLFELNDETLKERSVGRIKVEQEPGYPCRITLRDASIGEKVIALSYQHQPANSPYKASGPIFVREGAERAACFEATIPPMLKLRPQSIRAYDQDHWIVKAEVSGGDDLDGVIREMLSEDQVAYLHIHNAKPGCFNCRVDRA